jgi:dTDP-4-dehydrorhamnose reductase
MRLLVLGGDGMLGHQLLLSLAARHDVRVTLRRPLAAYAADGLFTPDNSIAEVEAADWDRLAAVVRSVRPEVVVNCIGIVKQRDEAKAAIPSIEINSLLPHRLRALCAEQEARLVHLSTDCVFSGRRGGYREEDIPDPVDLYGRSKLLGEVAEAPGLTLRTSIIGLELRRRTGLVEWFLAQRGRIRGYRHAIYTGFTTQEMARVIERLLTAPDALHGVWHLASEPISKYHLLARLADQLGRRDVEIVPDDDLVCDRSLDGGALAAALDYRPPSWDSMLAELAGDIERRRSSSC